MLAAGVAFYSLLAIFPALAAAVSIYGLFADPHDVEQQAGLAIEPRLESAAIIHGPAQQISLSQPRRGLGFCAIFALLFAAVELVGGDLDLDPTGLNVVV